MRFGDETGIGRVSLTALALSYAGLSTAPLHAQVASPPANAAPADAEGDIIVTARKRDESLITVPVAVSALNQASLARYSATDLSRIADNIPTVQVTRAASGNGALIAIRGIYSSQLDAGLESAVSVSIDGVQLSRGYLIQAAFFDLQQVEVLKGPQALFFGKNSPAGVISLKSKGPGDSLEGYVKGGYEFRANERYIEGAIGGPVTETLGARIAVRASKMDGWLHNTAAAIANPFEPSLPLPGPRNNKTTPGARSIAMRATAEWKPASDFSATLKLLYSNYRDNDSSGLQQVVSCNGRPHPTTAGVQDPNADCKPDNHRAFGAPPTAVSDAFPFVDGTKYFSRNESYLGSLGLAYNINDNLTVNSQSGVYDLNARNFGNFDATSYAIGPVFQFEKNRIYTQELRLTSDYDSAVNFMIGGYYEHGKREYFNVLRGGFGFPIPFDPGFGGASVTYNADALVRTNAYSAFGQLLWDITTKLQLSGGARYTKEDKSASIGSLYVNPLFATAVATFRPAGSPLLGKFRDSNWSPEATLTWHPTPNQTLYAAYKTGYKSGGFSTNGVILRTNTINALTFGSETAKGAEVGYKAQFFDRRLTFTSAIFSYKFSNLQRSALNIATTTFQVTNAAAARTKGIEAEWTFRANDSFSLRASGTYNKAYYLNFRTAPCFNGQPAALGCIGGVQNLTGQTIALAPRFSSSAGFTFDTPVTDLLGFALTGDVRYVSRYRTQDDRTPGSIQDGYAKFNASARIHNADETWEISLIGLNIFNKYAVLFSSAKPYGASGDLYGPVERGREVRLQAGFKF